MTNKALVADFEQYLNTKTDYLKPFDNAEFGELYHKHKSVFYLKNITENMLKDLGIDCEEGSTEWHNFQSWVYMFGNTIRTRETNAKNAISNSLKEKIKTMAGQKVALVIQGENFLGGEVEKESVFRVVKNHEDKYFLMPKGAKKRGYVLDSMSIIIKAIK